MCQWTHIDIGTTYLIFQLTAAHCSGNAYGFHAGAVNTAQFYQLIIMKQTKDLRFKPWFLLNSACCRYLPYWRQLNSVLAICTSFCTADAGRCRTVIQFPLDAFTHMEPVALATDKLTLSTFYDFVTFLPTKTLARKWRRAPYMLIALAAEKPNFSTLDDFFTFWHCKNMCQKYCQPFIKQL